MSREKYLRIIRDKVFVVWLCVIYCTMLICSRPCTVKDNFNISRTPEPRKTFKLEILDSYFLDFITPYTSYFTRKCLYHRKFFILSENKLAIILFSHPKFFLNTINEKYFLETRFLRIYYQSSIWYSLNEEICP